MLKPSLRQYGQVLKGFTGSRAFSSYSTIMAEKKKPMFPSFGKSPSKSSQSQSHSRQKKSGNSPRSLLSKSVESARTFGITKTNGALTGSLETIDKAKETKENQSKYSDEIISPFFMYNFEHRKRYDPFDFSLSKLRLEKKWRSKISNPLDDLHKNPLTLYIYPQILSNYMNSAGQILNRRVTGCKGRTQRKVTKAIKRAQHIGFLSTVHKDVRTLIDSKTIHGV